MPSAIGIDLGTTYSCVGVFQHGKVEIIANDQGNRTTPSYVAFSDTERLIGDAAKNQVAMNPTNTVFDAKRLIGRRYDDPKIQADIKHWPFKVVNDCGKPKIQVEFKGERKTMAEKEEYDHKMQELTRACSPIMTKLHQQSGAGPSPTSCGQQAGGFGGRTGPTVEEVD
ncbi:AGAP004582-PA [Anopheles gambiae str. PEST]|uniref:AGAP004582-PA n=1 Tax=Anopheles gambiae TaxID=7165 RepID=A0NEA0_ANOGA|nr:AGAP004582-PA [Anopheles gambiae str. PEST]